MDTNINMDYEVMVQQSSGLHELPIDILGHLFEFLDQRSLRTLTQLNNKQWNRQLQHIPVQKLEEIPEGERSLAILLEFYPRVQHCHFNVACDHLQLMQKLSITSLELRNYHCEKCKKRIASWQYPPSLTRLAGVNYSPGLQYLTQLKTLEIRSILNISRKSSIIYPINITSLVTPFAPHDSNNSSQLGKLNSLTLKNMMYDDDEESNYYLDDHIHLSDGSDSSFENHDIKNRHMIRLPSQLKILKVDDVGKLTLAQLPSSIINLSIMQFTTLYKLPSMLQTLKITVSAHQYTLFDRSEFHDLNTLVLNLQSLWGEKVWTDDQLHHLMSHFPTTLTYLDLKYPSSPHVDPSHQHRLPPALKTFKFSIKQPQHAVDTFWHLPSSLTYLKSDHYHLDHWHTPQLATLKLMHYSHEHADMVSRLKHLHTLSIIINDPDITLAHLPVSLTFLKIKDSPSGQTNLTLGQFQPLLHCVQLNKLILGMIEPEFIPYIPHSVVHFKCKIRESTNSCSCNCTTKTYKDINACRHAYGYDTDNVVEQFMPSTKRLCL